MSASADVSLTAETQMSGRQAKGALIEFAALGVLGVGLGISQVFHGFYAETTWGPIALVVLAVLVALVVGGPRRIPVAAVLALLGLAIWSLISSSWADSADNAWSAANRWLLYGTALAVLLWLVAGDARRGQSLLVGCAIGVVGVALWMLIGMLRGHGASLFLGTRLNDPLGYVNGQAGYLLAGVWPCCALAERRRPALLAGLGMAGGVLLVGLGVLTDSRSWAFGLACALVVVLAVLPGRRRRLAIILLAALAIFLIHGWLAQTTAGSATSDGAARHAAVAIGLASLVCAVAWGSVVWGLDRWAPRHGAGRRRLDLLSRAVLVLLAIAAAAALGANARRIGHTVHRNYNSFVHLAPTAGSSRFLSGGGNRYDYWRVAWHEFRSSPFHGVGAGNYPLGYYRMRRTTESITQPHSLELQTLAELGAVGLALLLTFIAAVGWGVFRIIGPARSDLTLRWTAVAGSGLFVAWLAQTSVDWEHLLPGLTLMSLAGVAALHTGNSVQALVGRSRAALLGAGAVIACGGAILIAPRVLALNAQGAANTALQRGDVPAAVRDATRALQYDGDSVRGRVLRAAAFARADAFELARADLEHALRTEPQNWTTWALLGDLLTRHGDLREAKASYRHAERLDPLDTGIAPARGP